ncbi:hypothetical protein L5F68_09205 [Aliarcobacter butzleri]|uniref:hypothetical protein n=1 Tax=Aliarcobacter butzleri TaxID=28197 RepID=UPI001EDDD204|nr:hypothetical protein [Aliarcobacter butzleri]MCG3704500.1 hypothetical protein [Aliarcobacter butzleri]
MNNLIIGNGMFAKAFKKSNAKNCIFFCSGVSSSNEISELKFKREEILIYETLKSVDKQFIYFSSILAPQMSNEYYKHKINMENIISSISNNYLIIRLPQVVGEVLNDTLFPNFVSSIYQKKVLSIYKESSRTIIDIDDVIQTFDNIYKDNISNKTINLYPEYHFHPLKLMWLISKELNLKPNYYLVNKSSIQQFIEDNTIISYKLKINTNNYLEKIVKKYTKRIVRLLDKKTYQQLNKDTNE